MLADLHCVTWAFGGVFFLCFLSTQLWVTPTQVTTTCRSPLDCLLCSDHTMTNKQSAFLLWRRSKCSSVTPGERRGEEQGREVDLKGKKCKLYLLFFYYSSLRLLTGDSEGLLTNALIFLGNFSLFDWM